MSIVISMTSYGERLKTLHSRLTWVKYVPILFNLYVGDTEVLEQDLLEFFKTTKNAKLHIVRDIGPLTKSYYALQDFPDDVVFLIDDDNYYSAHWIKFAIDSYVQHQHMFSNCVIGLVARKIVNTPDNHYEIMKYGENQNDYQTTLNHYTGHAKPLQPSYRNIILSGGPGSFLNINQVHTDFFNVDKYQSICKSHDEMWNWIHSVRMNLQHVSLHSALIAPGTVQELQSTGLDATFNSIQHEQDIFDKFIENWPEVQRKLVLDI